MLNIASRIAQRHHRVLGFDFGLKRIGVAAGNLETCTAQALTTMPARNGAPLWREMDELIARWLPGKLVVGVPFGGAHGDADGEIAHRARAFGKALRARFSLEVVFIDERLTSVAADRLMDESPRRLTPQRRRNARDNLAAELIVRTYFAEHRRV